MAADGRPDEPSVVGFVRVAVEGERVAGPDELRDRCSFPVYLPSYWPELCSPRMYEVRQSLFGTEYAIKGGTPPQFLMLIGGAPRSGVHHSEDMKEVKGIPFPTLGCKNGPAVHLLAEPPGTVIHLIATLPLKEATAVVQSLQVVRPSPEDG